MNNKESAISFPIKPPGPPKVWKVIDIKRKGMDTSIRFTIQELPEDRYEEVLEHMCKYFIADEPFCKCLGGLNDPEYVETFRGMWQDFLKHGLAVAAFTEDPKGGEPILAGVNVLYLSFKDEIIDYSGIKSKNALNVTEVVVKLSKEANIYEKYGIDKYIGAFGLSVHPSYRGLALGSHLLNARVDVGREYKQSVTATVFSSPISQKLAERCGFETLLEKNYDEIVDENGKQMFPGIEAKVIKVMARRLY